MIGAELEEKNRVTYEKLFGCEWDFYKEVSSETPESTGFLTRFFNVLKKVTTESSSAPKSLTSPRSTVSVQSTVRPISPRKRSLSRERSFSPARMVRDNLDMPEPGPLLPRRRRSSSGEGTSKDNIDKQFEKCANLLKSESLQAFLVNFKSISNEYLVKYIRENNSTEEWIKFLSAIQIKIAEEKFLNEIQSEKQSLLLAEQKYQQLLVEKGLTEKISVDTQVLTDEELKNIFSETSADKFKYVTLIYNICTGSIFDGNINCLNIRNLMIGLMREISSTEDIADILYKLLAMLKGEQQLMALFMLKEMIVWDHFCHSYQTITIPSFPTELKVFEELLENIARFKRKTEPPILQAHIRINTILTKCYTQPVELKNKVTPENFANQLRAITLLFYQSLNFAKFLEQANEHAAHFDNLSQYITANILNQGSQNASIACLTFYIRVLSLLLKDHPDFNSAFIVFSGIEAHCVTRLKVLFSRLDEKTQEELESARKLLQLSTAGNKEQHQIISQDENSIPFSAMIAKEVTAASENGKLQNKAEITGKLYRDLIQRQKKLKETFLLLEPSLLIILNTRKMLTDVELQLLSGKMEAMPVYLDDITLEELEKVFDFYTDNPDLSLTLSYGGKKVKEKKFQIGLFFEWLVEYFKERDTTLALRIINKANKYFGHEEFNTYHKCHQEFVLKIHNKKEVGKKVNISPCLSSKESIQSEGSQTEITEKTGENLDKEPKDKNLVDQTPRNFTPAHANKRYTLSSAKKRVVFVEKAAPKFSPQSPR